MDRTHDEIRAEYVRSMGQDLGQLYHELEDDMAWLHDKWGELKELFGKGQQRIDLLNEVASSFFYIVHQVFYEDILLHLSRLTDPAKSPSRRLNQSVPNLSFLRVPELISDPTLKTCVEAATVQILKKCEFARDYRNRRLAHRDLMTLRNAHPIPLPSVNMGMVEDVLASIRDLHRLLGQHYGHPHVLYSGSSNPWGAQSLLHFVERGVRAIEEERERWRKIAEDQETELKSR
ncbi:MAG: hypothetical protein HY316_02225 [Acidobacteria bacterium]|nr:hypothetical protein [Acidobacteriota bacterium]